MKKTVTLITLLLFTKVVFSQLNPFGSMYFQNQYLANPAMLGLTTGWELNAARKAQWTNIDGTPTMQSITAGFGSANNKVGAGLNLYHETAGVINRSSFRGTYAYHLPLNDKTTIIDFGLSAGLTSERIDFSKVKGDITDQSLYNFNQRELYFDGDFGIAYRNQKLTIQSALPNLNRLLNRNFKRLVVDQYLFMAAASYKFIGKPGTSLTNIEPKITYRNIKNYTDILDIGVNAEFSDKKLMLNAMYHTTGSLTIGAGTTYRNQFTVLCQYTSNTSALSGYSNGEFEIGIKYNLKKQP